MTGFHAAIVHPDQSVTYCGVVDPPHVDQARAIAAPDDAPRFVAEHPRHPGSVFVLREDGDLDWYEPVDAVPAPVHEPDAQPLAGAAEELHSLDGAPLPRTGGSSGTIWIAGAIRLGDGRIGGAMDTPGNPPRLVHHTTESPAGGRYLESIGSYLIRVGSEPQLIYCPVTDRVGQFGPLNQSGRALRNDGSRRTNREGRVCIQVEVLGRAAQPWTSGWDPAKKPGWQKILSAARSWGVPDEWPAGPPPKYPGGYSARSRSIWQNKGGHFGHVDVPGNNHGDPGAIDSKRVLGGTATAPAPRPPADKDAFPGVGKFGPGANNAYVTRLGTMLIAQGGRHFYSVGPGPRWGEADRNATRAFQQAQGWSGADADGIPGPTTWKLLVSGGGKDIPSAAKAKATVKVSHLVAAAKKDPAAPQGHTTYKAEVEVVEDALVAEGLLERRWADGSFGTKSITAYAAWQRSKAGGSYTGAAADGIPGIDSLRRLAARRGFTATT
ncbi:peptidoglycan-binding protein [Streptomyces sp. NPDC090026]|uniref:peptidoglycan-binding protein n=1 Tax=Streptomyces sp. NPDC090026 TaxID=3365923 RepID=UPI003826B427